VDRSSLNLPERRVSSGGGGSSFKQARSCAGRATHSACVSNGGKLKTRRLQEPDPLRRNFMRRCSCDLGQRFWMADLTASRTRMSSCSEASAIAPVASTMRPRLGSVASMSAFPWKEARDVALRRDLGVSRPTCTRPTP